MLSVILDRRTSCWNYFITRMMLWWDFKVTVSNTTCICLLIVKYFRDENSGSGVGKGEECRGKRFANKMSCFLVFFWHTSVSSNTCVLKTTKALSKISTDLKSTLKSASDGYIFYILYIIYYIFYRIYDNSPLKYSWIQCPTNSSQYC